jgi:uncharacterized protein
LDASRSKLLTVPEPVTGDLLLFPTGNEYISLPETNRHGGIQSINLLRLDLNGLLDFRGDSDEALLTPTLEVRGEELISSASLNWHYKLGWLPCFEAILLNNLQIKGLVASPPGVKGFIYQVSLYNRGENTVTVAAGWQGCWKSFNYTVLSSRKLEAKRSLAFNHWTNSLVLEAQIGLPLAALAFSTEPATDWLINAEKGNFQTAATLILEPGALRTFTLYGAINLEADGAATTNVDLRRHGAAALIDQTQNWLEQRYINLGEPDLEELLNKNLFFSYFYTTARSLDSDQLVALTSRSPRYYVSGAYWSRDALLWSFPAILLVDQSSARDLLLAVYSRHTSHAGDHAHYFNGQVLYPGFELDQLAAYLIALEHYLRRTGDYEILEEKSIRNGLDNLADKVFQKFDPACGLYGTFLDPSDDPADYPFLTYNNALLQRAFCFMADLQQQDLWFNRNDFAILACELETAIYEHCTVHGPCGLMFAWAVDGKGKFKLYDNPPGSLQLLAHYGFCSSDDNIFLNTVRWIRSPNNNYFHPDSSFMEAGSLHCSNPWPLGACNDLLALNVSALDFLRRVKMDNGFFCETVDPETGTVSTGAAFASAAGFLAAALADHFKTNHAGGKTK